NLVVTPAPVEVMSVSIQAIRLGNSKNATGFIVLKLSGAINAQDAQSISSYSLTTIPSNPKQKSRTIKLSQAIYNSANHTVRLKTRSPLVLNPPLRLTINASKVIDTLGRPLDGDYNGQPGGNLVLTLAKSSGTGHSLKSLLNHRTFHALWRK